MAARVDPQLFCVERWQPGLRQFVQQLQALLLGMTAGPGMLLIVALAITGFTGGTGAAPLPWIPWAVAGTALAGWILAEIWAQHMVRTKFGEIVVGKGRLFGIPGNSDLNKALSGFINEFGDVGRLFTIFFLSRFLRSAVLEGLAFLATVGYLLSPNPLSLGAAIILIIAIPWGFPTLNGVTQWIVEMLRRLEYKRAESFSAQTAGPKER
ncbi:MAG: hypothetical protein NZ899_08520 [Thermoguttaceae bacterium]|nr:hypothetical protein [Thermoguttaceae bacterium]MDW8078339.1 hypothetical protein [Thermoguttaceae bacterium]